MNSKQDLCACGNIKLVNSMSCKPCYDKRRAIVPRFCECGNRKINKTAIHCRSCYRKHRTNAGRRDTCECGSVKNMYAKQCMTCYLKRVHERSSNPDRHKPSVPLTLKTYHGMLGRCGYRSGRIKDGYEHVSICDRWLTSYDNFLEDMGPRPGKNYDLDRIEQAGDYERDNCQWLEHKEHMRKTALERWARVEQIGAET